MTLSKKHEAQLLKIAASLQSIVAEAKKSPDVVKRASPAAKAARAGGGGTRRRGKDLVEFKKSIKKERKAGVSVAELAEKYGVTPSYLYQLRD